MVIRRHVHAGEQTPRTGIVLLGCRREIVSYSEGSFSS